MVVAGRAGALSSEAHPRKTLSPSTSTTWWAIHAGHSERSFSDTQQLARVLKKMIALSAHEYYECTPAKRALVRTAAATRLDVTRIATTRRKPRKIHSS